jgi:hypothetical protein
VASVTSLKGRATGRRHRQPARNVPSSIDADNDVLAVGFLTVGDLLRSLPTWRPSSALDQIDPAGGPPPGLRNFFRGGLLAVYDGEAQEALGALKGHIDAELAAEVWQAALGATWQGHPVWFHGDAQPGILRVKDRRLWAVIDSWHLWRRRFCL